MKILQFLGTVIFVVLMIAASVFILKTAFAREYARQEAVGVYNCRHYGTAINRYAGEEVCAPTPQG